MKSGLNAMPLFLLDDLLSQIIQECDQDLIIVFFWQKN